MRLTDLFPAYQGDANPEVKGMAADSRAVQQGFLFVALPGVKSDGYDFINDAIGRGAVAVLAERPFDGAAIPVIADAHPRHALALAAARFYGRQPAVIAAVTGTNGKTSTAFFAQQLWNANGYKAASLGTIGVQGLDAFEQAGHMTTPDSITLHADLARLADAGVDHLAMEASSHGLDQHRIDGVKVRIAAFTNLTLDHLDYHKTMDAYRQAKLRLFTDVLAPDGIAVLNADVPEYGAFKTAAGNRAVIDYGRNAARLRLQQCTARPDGQDLDIVVNNKAYRIRLNLVGEFMAMNVLCALGIVLAAGGDVEQYIGPLSRLYGAPGRLQMVEGVRVGAIYVDYAHTSDALDHVLKALRPHVHNRLIVVMGCGGDRDRSKRPLMGRLATELADIAIITDDNPRTENAAAIRAEVMKGAGSKALEIGNRRQAIRRAVALMQEGDILAITGKGHEQGQIVGDKTYPFDDVEEAKAAIEGVKA